MERIERKNVRDHREQLLTLVNVWDPAGLLGAGGSRDRYAFILDELLAMLKRNASKEELRQLLLREMRGRFNIEPQGIDAFVTQMTAWYRLETS